MDGQTRIIYLWETFDNLKVWIHQVLVQIQEWFPKTHQSGYINEVCIMWTCLKCLEDISSLIKEVSSVLTHKLGVPVTSPLQEPLTPWSFKKLQVDNVDIQLPLQEVIKRQLKYFFQNLYFPQKQRIPTNNITKTV